MVNICKIEVGWVGGTPHIFFGQFVKFFLFQCRDVSERDNTAEPAAAATTLQCPAEEEKKEKDKPAPNVTPGTLEFVTFPPSYDDLQREVRKAVNTILEMTQKKIQEKEIQGCKPGKYLQYNILSELPPSIKNSVNFVICQ